MGLGNGGCDWGLMRRGVGCNGQREGLWVGCNDSSSGFFLSHAGKLIECVVGAVCNDNDLINHLSSAMSS